MTHPLSTELNQRSSAVTLSAEEITRYSRQILLPDVGLAGQKRLKAARLLIIGLGGLGSPASLYLAAAGVGTLGLAEFDRVDISNLQRQVLYTTSDQGSSKLKAAATHLRSLNPHITVIEHHVRVDPSNVQDLVTQYDIVLDGSDNLATRYLVADACALVGKPLVYGAVYRFGGQVTVFYSPQGPCYRCLFPTPPAPEDVPSCAESGILGVMPGQVGILQATEALKLILDVGSTLIGRLVTIDGRTCQFSEFRLSRDPQCPLCGASPSIIKPENIAYQCSASKPQQLPTADQCGRDKAEITAEAVKSREIRVDDFERLRTSNSNILVIDVRSPEEAAICAIPGHRLLPLKELPKELSTLPKNVPMVFYCKTGRRSLEAVRLCLNSGLGNVMSLKDGIVAWSAIYRPDAPKY